MYYYLIIAIQVFCIYHLYKNRNNYYWIFAIVFLPLVGCVVYLLTHVYNKRDVEKIQEDITTVINPTKKIKDLQNKLEFSETFQNRLNLADGYFEIKDYPNAIKQYQKTFDESSQNDFYLVRQLIASYYSTQDYEKVVELAERFKSHPEFNKSQTQFLYGMALDHTEKIVEAEVQLQSIDKPYSNYNERLAYINFLIKHDKTDQAKIILDEVYDETLNMTKMNRRNYRTTILEIEKLKQSL